MRLPVPRPAARDRTAALAAGRSVDIALAVCGLLAATLVVADLGAPIAAVFVAAAFLLVPGWACIRPLRLATWAAHIVGAVLASTAITALLSLAMAWTALWYPQPVAVVVLLAASAFLVLTRRKAPAGRAPTASPRDRDFAWWIPTAVGVAALLLWIVGLALTDTSAIGAWGLLPAFSLPWYLAVATMLGLCVWGVTARRLFPTAYLAAALGLLVSMLYASANIVESAPRLPWTYKHIAVTSFIDTFGRVDPSIDLYNRWPGFFTFSAFLGRITSYRDPIAYATWAELIFPLVDAALVFGIARAISANARISWAAALVFSVCNWVNQNYYSPQAFAFTLYLALCLVAMTMLRDTPAPWVVAFESRVLRSLGRAPRHAPPSPGSGSARSVPIDLVTSRELRGQRQIRIAAIAAVLVLQAVIAASHQLSPYLAALGLLPLSLLGYIRPRWLGPAVLAIAIAYLIPNLGFVQSTYGLFSGFDFFANATYTPPNAAQATEAAQFGSRAATALSALILVLAAAGWLRNLLRGNMGTTIIVAWLAAAPVLALVGQAYGGEGRLRVFLFGLPWYAIGVAWLFWSGPVVSRKLVLGFSAALAAMAALFTIAYFQPEADHVVSQRDIRAAMWLDARVAKDDLAVEAVGNFPLFIGPHYWLFDSATRSSTLAPYLLEPSTAISEAGIERYLKSLALAPHTYVIFSDTQEEYASTHKLFEVSLLTEAENEIRTGQNFRLVYDSSAVRIYEMR